MNASTLSSESTACTFGAWSSPTCSRGQSRLCRLLGASDCHCTVRRTDRMTANGVFVYDIEDQENRWYIYSRRFIMNLRE